MNDSPALAEQQPRRELQATPPKAGGKVQPIVPQSMEELKYVAGLIVKNGLAPESYTVKDQRGQIDREATAGRVAIGIMKGAEVGLAPITALQWIAIVNGRPSIWGDGAIALVQNSGLLEDREVREIGAAPGESAEVNRFADDYGYEVRLYRRGQTEPYVGRFTVGDAKRAKLWMSPKRQPWLLYPRRMLKWRAIGFAIRDGFADCLSGMMIQEEAQDAPPVQAEEPKQPAAFLDDDAPAAPLPAAEAETQGVETVESAAGGVEEAGEQSEAEVDAASDGPSKDVDLASDEGESALPLDEPMPQHHEPQPEEAVDDRIRRWFDGDSLQIPLQKDESGGWQFSRWSKRLLDAIEAAPSAELLEKLWFDNDGALQIVAMQEPNMHDDIRDAWQVRADDFAADAPQPMGAGE